MVWDWDRKIRHRIVPVYNYNSSAPTDLRSPSTDFTRPLVKTYVTEIYQNGDHRIIWMSILKIRHNALAICCQWSPAKSLKSSWNFKQSIPKMLLSRNFSWKVGLCSVMGAKAAFRNKKMKVLELLNCILLQWLQTCASSHSLFVKLQFKSKAASQNNLVSTSRMYNFGASRLLF